MGNAGKASSRGSFGVVRPDGQRDRQAPARNTCAGSSRHDIDANRAGLDGWAAQSA